MPSTKAPLNTSQVKILRALSNGRTVGRTSAEIVALCPGVSLSSSSKQELYDLGYLTGKLDLVDGRMTTLYSITAAGRRAAQEYQIRERVSAKIDVTVLDRVVIKFRPTRVYGIESYTDADIEQIRQEIGESASNVSVDDLRNQIANRRKQGAYADPAEKVKRASRAALQAFGPDGWIVQDLLTSQQVYALEQMIETGRVYDGSGETMGEEIEDLDAQYAQEYEENQ